MYMQGLTEAERKKPMNLAGIGGKAITEEVSLALDPERSGVFNRQQREDRSSRKYVLYCQSYKTFQRIK